MPALFARRPAVALLLCAAALTGCASGGGTAPSQGAQAASDTAVPAAGPVLSGAAIAEMSRQYEPRSGMVAGAGASAWVPPAPPPAFAVTELPQAAAPAPSPFDFGPPSPPRSADAADAPRPEAAAPAQQASAPGPASVPAADFAKGRALFNDWTCNICHALADAGASGGIGPALDGNRALTVQSVAAIVTHGQGAMPGFGGQMSDEDIAALAAYIVAAKR